MLWCGPCQRGANRGRRQSFETGLEYGDHGAHSAMAQRERAQALLHLRHVRLRAQDLRRNSIAVSHGATQTPLEMPRVLLHRLALGTREGLRSRRGGTRRSRFTAVVLVLRCLWCQHVGEAAEQARHAGRGERAAVDRLRPRVEAV